MVKDDYETSVNRRVTEKAQDDLRKNGIPILRNLFLGHRYLFRNILPTADAIEVGIAKDNPEIKQQIIEEDKKTSETLGKELSQGFIKLLATPGYYDPLKGDSYRSIDLTKLRQEIKLNSEEEKILESMSKKDEGVAISLLNLPESARHELLSKIQIFQIQQALKYLASVRLPQNDWVRDLFGKDGTLQEGKEKAFMARLSPQGNPEEQILDTRQSIVMLSYLNKVAVDGKAPGRVMKEVGLTQFKEESGKKEPFIPISNAWLISVTLFKGYAYHTKNPQLIARAEALANEAYANYSILSAEKRIKYKKAVDCLMVPIQSSYDPVSDQPKTGFGG